MLFKYAQLPHAEALALRGEVLLSRPGRFHDMDEFGVAIGDGVEGVREVVGENLILDGTRDPPPGLRHWIKGRPRIYAKHIRMGQQPDNVLIFSTSRKFRKSLMKAFDADACVEIEQAKRFAECISAALVNRAEFIGMVDCIYGAKSNDYMHPHAAVPNYQLKKKEHRDQYEVRFIWNVKDDSIGQKLLVTNTQIPTYCRLRSTP